MKSTSLLFTLALLCASSSYAMMLDDDRLRTDKTIHDASFYKYHKRNGQRIYAYYRNDGHLLRTKVHFQKGFNPNDYLDPYASWAQPTSCKVSDWPYRNPSRDVRKSNTLCCTFYAGDTVIAMFNYDPTTKTILVFDGEKAVPVKIPFDGTQQRKYEILFKLDLSKIIKKPVIYAKEYGTS